jgi:hypothetical protein
MMKNTEFVHYVNCRRDVAAVLDEQGWERIKEADGLTREGPVGKNIQRKIKKMDLEEELKVSFSYIRRDRIQFSIKENNEK